jgi:hypothetical protein
VNKLKFLIDKELEENENEQPQGHFSPSSFLRENPMVSLSKQLADVTSKAHEMALQIEEGEKRIMDATN